MPHKKSTSNSIQNVKYTSINKENEPGKKVLTFSPGSLTNKIIHNYKKDSIYILCHWLHMAYDI